MKFLLSSRLAAAGVAAAVLGLSSSSSSSSNNVVVSAAAAESSSSSSTSSLEVGQRICVEGYVMDYYCIERGRLLDNNSVKTLEQPGKHSVHCLVDVKRCYESPFEILVDPPPNADDDEGGKQLYYKRGWRMTQETQDKTIQVARSVGVCSTCNNNSNGGSINRGFRAAFDAIIVDLGDPSKDIPKTIEATRIQNSNDIDNPCQELFGMDEVDGDDFAVPPGDNAGGGGTLRPVILAHGALMMIGWGLLLPSGAIIAKFYKHRRSANIWFQIHRSCQMIGLIIALVGWIIALKNFDVFASPGYKEYYHGIMGCTVMAIGLFQPLNAAVRPHPPPSSEEEEESEQKSTLRLVWEIIHKSLGWVAILLAVATIVLGTTFLQPSDAKKYQYAYGIGCGGCLLILIVYICFDKTKYNNDNFATRQKEEKEEGKRDAADVAQPPPPEAAMQGP